MQAVEGPPYLLVVTPEAGVDGGRVLPARCGGHLRSLVCSRGVEGALASLQALFFHRLFLALPEAMQAQMADTELGRSPLCH